MNDLINKLKTPRDCEVFAKNAAQRGRNDLAMQAQRRSIELKAMTHGANSQAEKECLEAIYAYERTLFHKNGKNTRATRTWQMLTRHGIIEAVNRTVMREEKTAGFKALAEMGLQDRAFEAVVVRYPALFSDEAVKRSKERILAQQEFLTEWAT